MVELLQPHPLFQEVEVFAALNDNFALEFPRAVWPVKPTGSDICGQTVVVNRFSTITVNHVLDQMLMVTVFEWMCI